MKATERDWKAWYATLKNAEPDVYRKAIQYAEGVSLNHNLADKAAAACEVSHVMLACELLGLKPSALDCIPTEGI